jgi:hypothetical protein
MALKCHEACPPTLNAIGRRESETLASRYASGGRLCSCGRESHRRGGLVVSCFAEELLVLDVYSVFFNLGDFGRDESHVGKSVSGN